ncbi:MAG: hypothetical protein LBK66_12150 [Spirochaetaceae bacterium]|nr:hypothetical protein [Spirochaetaceae bacterium]
MKKHLFCGLVTAVAALFAACTAGGDVAGEEAEILDSSPRYSISVNLKPGEGNDIDVNSAGVTVTSSPSGKVKKGTTVTLSAHLEGGGGVAKKKETPLTCL